jgi:hypothetical protein
MAATFEAPASHEMAHEAAHEWEWEHPEAHEWETHEWEHPEAHEWETHEWEAPEAHEWETHEWETPEAHEWETHEWEAPEAHEWETHEREHPEAHEWEAHEWETPEAHEWETHEAHEWETPEAHEWETHEWETPEADPFFGGLKRRLLKGVAGLARRVAPGAIRALAGMIPGVGAIAGPLLGQLTQRLVSESEYLAAEAEAEAFGGSNGESEIGSSEVAHEAALSELLAAEAAAAGSEAEAVSTIAATLPLTITVMRARRAVRPVIPTLNQANIRLSRSLRRSGPQGRQLLRTMPTIQRRAVGNIVAAARAGVPVTPPLAARAMAAATRSVLTNPSRVEIAVGRNVMLRRRTAPPTPRRALTYRPRRPTPYSPRRAMAYGRGY